MGSPSDHGKKKKAANALSRFVQTLTEQRGLIHLFFAALAVWSFYHFVFSSQGLIIRHDMAEKIHQLEDDNSAVETEISGLEQKNKDIRNSSFYVERSARVDFGMSRVNENIYHIVTKNN